jgi:hypothetical protein
VTATEQVDQIKGLLKTTKLSTSVPFSLISANWFRDGKPSVGFGGPPLGTSVDAFANAERLSGRSLKPGLGPELTSESHVQTFCRSFLEQLEH